MCSYTNIATHYKINFGLTRHNYSETEIDAMYPFERDIKISMLNDMIEKQKQKENEQ